MPSKWGWIQPQVTKLDHPRSMPFLPSRGLRCEYEYCSSINFNNDAINTFSCGFQWLSMGSDDRSNFLAPTRSLSRCIKICSLIEKCLFLELAHFQRRKIYSLVCSWPCFWIGLGFLCSSCPNKPWLSYFFFSIRNWLSQSAHSSKSRLTQTCASLLPATFFNKAPLQLFKCFFFRTEIF